MDITRWNIQLAGMTCDYCAFTVESALRSVPGVREVRIRFAESGGWIEAESKVSAKAIQAAVTGTGYRVAGLEPASPHPDRSGEEPHKPKILILGGGSAAFAAALRAHELGARVTMVNAGTIGGTCVNIGCIPSKALIRAAEAHHRARTHSFAGIRSTSHLESLARLVAQKDELVHQLRREKYRDIATDLPDLQLIEGTARFMDYRTVRVNGQTLRAEKILIATGASPHIPEVPGLAETGYLTSTTALALQALPKSLVVLGGRYIALELSQLFARLGTRVTILQRSERILPTETPDLTEALTHFLTEEGIEIVTRVSLLSVARDGIGLTVQAKVGEAPRTFRAEQVLVATGRRANTRGLALEETGIQLREDGSIAVNDHLETTVPGVYAAGDVIGEPMFVYTAAYEGALAAENALLGNTQSRDYTALPWVIFTDPQVAGVGMDERQATEAGQEVDVARLDMAYVPKALVARDTRGFIKLIRNRANDRLVGARILAPEGGELIMEASLAIRYGIPVADLARAFHPYLTHSEGIKLAAIAFSKDVGKLSCCAT